MAAYTIGFLLFDNAEELDFVGPMEVFNTTTQVAKYMGLKCANKTIFMSQTGKDIVGAKGMQISMDCALTDAPHLDVLCIPGGRGVREEIYNQTFLDQIADKAPHCTWLACVGTGAFLLSAAGLTDGKKLATHWSTSNEFVELGLKGEVITRSRYIRDGNLLTSSGVSAGIDMCLWLTGQLHTIAMALATQRAIDHDQGPAIPAYG